MSCQVEDKTSLQVPPLLLLQTLAATDLSEGQKLRGSDKKHVRSFLNDHIFANGSADDLRCPCWQFPALRCWERSYDVPVDYAECLEKPREYAKQSVSSVLAESRA